MGFDLSGKSGNSFSHTIHIWYPLWRKVSEISNLTQEQYNRGLYNDYETFSKEEANEISIKLFEYLKNNNDEDSVLVDFANFCKKSNGFAIG